MPRALKIHAIGKFNIAKKMKNESVAGKLRIL